MARKPRIHVPGACYHVILTGNNGREVFIDDEDREQFCQLLKEGVARYRYEIHAFSFLNNQINLAIQISEVPLSKVVQNFSFRYTRWFNKRHDRAGHLFQGRFKAVLVQKNKDFWLPLIRYVEMTPVRQGVVPRLEDFPWTSHPSYLGKDKYTWVNTRWVLSQFGDSPQAALKGYRAFMADQEGLVQDHQFEVGTASSGIAGDEHFVLRTQLTPPHESFIEKPDFNLDDVIDYVCEQLEIDRPSLYYPGKTRRLARARGIIGWLSTELGVDNLTNTARTLGRDFATLTKTINRLREQDLDTLKRFKKEFLVTYHGKKR